MQLHYTYLTNDSSTFTYSFIVQIGVVVTANRYFRLWCYRGVDGGGGGSSGAFGVHPRI